MKRIFSVLATVVVLGLMSTNASAGMSFNDDFTGGASTTYWTNIAAATYDNDEAAFAGADSDRDYIRTIGVDYATTDFVATIKLTNGTGWSGCIYFGLGEGTPCSDHYFEPMNGAYTFIQYYGTDTTTPLAVIKASNSILSTGDISSIGVNHNNIVTIGVQLSWVASTSTVTFNIDNDGDGDYDDFTYSHSNPDLSVAGETTCLFVGGSNGAIADNFSVIVSEVPEPSTLALLLAGLVGLAVIARRKRK